MGDAKKGFKKYLGLTFLIGFGFFTMGLMDILYDTYVPVFLGDILKKTGINSNALVGFIMSLDNILAIFLIPLVSVWSDNTRTKIGRRMPYIIVLLPLSAICFSLIPYAAGSLSSPSSSLSWGSISSSSRSEAPSWPSCPTRSPASIALRPMASSTRWAPSVPS